jgi:phosphoglycerate dehydrogenase-like enzyme
MSTLPIGKILVTPRSATLPIHESLQKLTDLGFELIVPSPGEMPEKVAIAAALKDAVGYIAGVEKIDESLLRQAKKLRCISRNGTGSDTIDLTVAHSLGIRVVTAPAANAQGVAELTIGHIFLLARGLIDSINGIREGKWLRAPGIELEGKILGVIGCGQIGKRVAQMALGLGMSVFAYDQFPDESFRPSGKFKYATLEKVLTTSNFLTLHCPPSDKPIINSSSLELVPRGTYLVNTARASLVDLDAAQFALDDGRLAGFACDVFDEEPPGNLSIAASSKFFGTAHIGGYTQESIDRAMHIAVDNLVEALKG